MGKRKLTPARIAANKRYDEKTYKFVALRLRVDKDADIIEDIARCKKEGIQPTEWVRRLWAVR